MLFTHWGRVTHICVGNLAIIGSDNGLSPGRRQAIIWTSAGILLIGPLPGANFSEILIGIQTLSFKKIHLTMSSAKWRPFCPGLNVFWLATNYHWLLFPFHCYTRGRLNIKMSMLKIRRSRDRLIFNMGIPYLGNTVFILKRGPCGFRVISVDYEKVYTNGWYFEIYVALRWPHMSVMASKFTNNLIVCSTVCPG